MTKKQLQSTRAQIWARQHNEDREGITIKLEGELTVTLRRISRKYLLRHGKIPDTLTHFALNRLPRITTTSNTLTPQATVDDLQRLDEYYKSICENVMVSPTLGDVADLDNDVITWDMVSEGHKTAIVELIEQPIEEWIRFRVE